MDIRKSLLAVLLIATLALGLYLPVQAMRGMPDSSDFGVGVRLYPEGPAIEESFQAVSSLHPDWLAVDLDWSATWPERDGQPDLAAFDIIMQKAAENNTPVMLSVQNAPRWVLTPAGPSAGLTAWFIQNLVQRYGQVIAAVELYPSPNTYEGWGAPPDPAAYAALYQAVDEALRKERIPVLLVTGGIEPIKVKRGSMDGVEFLSGLYAAGIFKEPAVIGVHLTELNSYPTSQVTGEEPVLRDYESLRQVMAENNRLDDLIWVTSFCPPSADAEWVLPAMQQMRSQLFMGVVFYDSLNPASVKKNDPSRTTALVQKNGKTTPLFNLLQEFVNNNNRLTGTGMMVPGVKYKQLTKTYNRPPYP